MVKRWGSLEAAGKTLSGDYLCGSIFMFINLNKMELTLSLIISEN